MSKTKDFAEEFISGLEVEDWSLNGKKLSLTKSGNKFEINLTITKHRNAAEIWRSGHFCSRCHDATKEGFRSKLCGILSTVIEEKEEIETKTEVNDDLCSYLTEELGLPILNKSSGTWGGSYVIEGKKHKYVITCSYEDAFARLFIRDNVNELVRKFELSNPNVSMVICQVIKRMEEEDG